VKKLDEILNELVLEELEKNQNLKEEITKQSRLPKGMKRENIIKLKELINRGWEINEEEGTIKNPETGRTIKIKTALSYDPSHPAYKLAKKQSGGNSGEEEKNDVSMEYDEFDNSITFGDGEKVKVDYDGDFQYKGEWFNVNDYENEDELKQAISDKVGSKNENTSMKISKSRLREIVKEVIKEESEYQEFFKKTLEKTGKSIPQMSDEEKKAFFDKIDAAWKGKGEKNEGNAFGAAVTKAKEEGEDSFEVGGKTYKVESVVSEGIKKGSIIIPYAMDKYGEFIVDKVFKNKYGETSYTGKFKNNGEKITFVLHSKDRVVKESVNEARRRKDPMDSFARDQGGSGNVAARGTVEKIKPNKYVPGTSWWAKNLSGSMKIFKSKSAAERFAKTEEVIQQAIKNSVNEVSDIKSVKLDKTGDTFQLGDKWRATPVRESVVNEKKVPKKGSPDYHQHKIAVDTVRNPMKSLMGGPSSKEAEETLIKKFGYSKKEVDKLKESVVKEGASSEEKRVVLRAIKALAKYRNGDLSAGLQSVQMAADELESDIRKGRVK
jgi:predicted DNA binding CopG/RHH family protein